MENHYIEFYSSFQEYTKFDTDDDNYKMLNFSPPLHKVNALQKKNKKISLPFQEVPLTTNSPWFTLVHTCLDSSCALRMMLHRVQY